MIITFSTTVHLLPVLDSARDSVETAHYSAAAATVHTRRHLRLAAGLCPALSLLYVGDMIRAYHVIFTAYGFWLPNDPRGSWSDYIRRWELLRFGPATKVHTRLSVAARPHSHELRQAAKRALKYPAVHFTGEQALSVARGFRRAIEESKYTVYACSILPEHVHMVLSRHRHKAERMVGHFKGRATQQLAADGRHPLRAWLQDDGTCPSPWADRAWRVYLNSDAAVLRAIRYVEENPVREGLPRQKWSFVVPYTNWTNNRRASPAAKS
jgi:REP element-mobilizing transposase RayT